MNRVRWEYNATTIDASGWFSAGNVDSAQVVVALNQLGEEGWELVSSHSTNDIGGGANKLVFLFKRPLAMGPDNLEEVGCCPNCNSIIPRRSTECPKCRALFGSGSSWRIQPVPK